MKQSSCIWSSPLPWVGLTSLALEQGGRNPSGSGVQGPKSSCSTKCHSQVRVLGEPCHKQESDGGHTQAAGNHIHRALKRDLSNSRGKMARKAPCSPSTEQEPSMEQELPGNPQLGQSIINNAWGSPGKVCNKCVCSGETACRGHRPHLAGNSRSCCLVLPVTLLLHPAPLPVTLLSTILKEINITSVLAFSI